MAKKKEKKETKTGLHKLLEDAVADIYYAENKLVKATLKMSKTAKDAKLKKAFLDHHKETKGQVADLKKVVTLLGIPAKGKKCDAIDGLLKEADGLASEFKGDPALDAALITAAQKVEHYEIASYGSMIAFAEQLDMKPVAKALGGILAQEKMADMALTGLAESALNAAGDR